MDPLARRPLGKSGLTVTALGFGGVPIGDFWARMPDERALATVRRAAEAGLGLFDTSPLYGHGLSEHRIGQVLRQRPRASFVLSTKVGRLLEPMPGEKINRGRFAGGRFRIVGARGHGGQEQDDSGDLRPHDDFSERINAATPRGARGVATVTPS